MPTKPPSMQQTISGLPGLPALMKLPCSVLKAPELLPLVPTEREVIEDRCLSVALFHATILTKKKADARAIAPAMMPGLGEGGRHQY